MSACPYCGFSPLPPNPAECPRCHTCLSPGPAERESEGTRLESVEDIRRWAEHNLAQAADAKSAPTSAPAPRLVDKAVDYRPVLRPPLALVCVVDDGMTGGEWIRLRADEWVVGRCEGDLVVACDDALSSRHLRLYRTVPGGRTLWHLQDLGSTNGTFVRVATALLKDKQEIIIGNTRFTFDCQQASPPAASNRNVTRAMQAISPSDLAQGPALIEQTGRRFTLDGNECWIGSEARLCSIVIGDDPFVSSRHAQLVPDEHRRWHLRDARSKNGTWLRIDKIALPSTAEFQAGEQRFQFKVLSRGNPIPG